MGELPQGRRDWGGQLGAEGIDVFVRPMQELEPWVVAAEAKPTRREDATASVIRSMPKVGYIATELRTVRP